MNLAVIGATGLVGEEILKVLQEKKIKINELTLVASNKSQGNTIKFSNNNYKIISVEKALEKKIDAAIFSAGKELSLKWATKFANYGVTVIDNSSAWRMDKT